MKFFTDLSDTIFEIRHTLTDAEYMALYSNLNRMRTKHAVLMIENWWYNIPCVKVKNHHKLKFNVINPCSYEYCGICQGSN